MAQFDVCRHRSRSDILLLNVQHDLMDQLKTRLVAPLLPESVFGRPADRLNPVFDVLDERYVMDTANLVGFPLSRFGAQVDNLSSETERIIGAIDFLTCGF